MADNLPDIYVKLEGLEGESTDAAHPGDKGWVQIKGFSFNFGLKGAGTQNLTSLMRGGKEGVDMAEQQKMLLEHMKAMQGQKDGAKKKDEGPFDRPDVTLNKSLDLA